MQQNNIDYEVLFSAFKSVSPLFMLLWVYRYDVIKLSLIPAFLVSLLVTVLYVLVSLNPVIEGAVWRLSIHYDDVIMMSRRQILGIPIFAMYYKSLVCFIFAYSLYFLSLAEWQEEETQTVAGSVAGHALCFFWRVDRALPCFCLFSLLALSLFSVSGIRAMPNISFILY